MKIAAARILTAAASVILAGSAIAKLVGAHRMVAGLTQAGVPISAIVPLGILELICLALYLFPRTLPLGVLLLTGYFGGATATHLIGGQQLWQPLLIGLVIWGGAWFRSEALKGFLL
jgi:hypothetical protein